MLVLAGPLPFAFDLHWLREVSSAALAGDVGLPVGGAQAPARLHLGGAFRKVVSLDEDGRLRLEVYRRPGAPFPFASRVSASVETTTPPPNTIDELAAAILGRHAGRQKDDSLGTSEETVATLLDLRDRIYRKAARALEGKLAEELSRSYQTARPDTKLLDVSFDFTAEGLRLYRQALQGDFAEIFTAPGGCAMVRPGALSHVLAREIRLELRLPFLSRREWISRLEAFAQMEVEAGDGGHLMVCPIEADNQALHRNSCHSTLALGMGLPGCRLHSQANFTLSYSDRRSLHPARLQPALAPLLSAYNFDGSLGTWLAAQSQAEGAIETSITLSVPGQLVSAWLDAPGDCSPEYFKVYSRVSVAIQSAMRRWLPYIYFEDLERYETLSLALPLLVYQVSRPFAGRPKHELTYDVLSDRSMDTFFHGLGVRLRAELANVSRLLRASGRPDAAASYAPGQARQILRSVRRSPRLVKSLLAADADFVNALVNLGCHCARLRDGMSGNPRQAVKQFAQVSADLLKSFQARLRRLYGGQDFTALGSLLLLEATNALAGADSHIRAVLRLSKTGDSPHVSHAAARETCGLSPLTRQDLLAHRVEVEPPLFDVGDVAQVRRLR